MVTPSESAVADVRTVQKCLAVIAMYVHMTSYQYTPQPVLEDKLSVDYIVVGAGSSGCVIANRLTENPDITVLVIEAGDDPPMETELPAMTVFFKNTVYDWNLTTQDVEDRKFLNKEIPFITQGKVLGGSSTIDYMNYIRGAPADYDAWADLVGDDSWKYKELLKFFKKSERFRGMNGLSKTNRKYHGTKGYMGVTKMNDNSTDIYMKAFIENGATYTEDVNGEQILGYTQPMNRIANGMRQNTAYTFLTKKFTDRSNLILYKQTTVTKILFDKNNNAIGVEAVNNGNTLTFMAKKEVIVTAGVFNSAKLLMLSGIGPKNHLKDKKINCISDLPVGIGLQEHTAALLAFNMGNQYFPVGPTNPHKHPSPMVYGSVALDPKAKTPDYASYNYLANSGRFTKYCSVSLGYSRDTCDKLFAKAWKTGGEVLLGVVANVHPESRGSVSLNSNNPSDKPLIDFGRFSEKKDLDNFVKYIEHYAGITKTDAFKSTGGFLVYLDLPDCDAEQGSTEYWRCYASNMAITFQSFAGTCAMGSVVDSNLLVLGVKRLRVADASVIPIITSGTMNVPSIMIGEKCAHIINGGKDYDDNNSKHHHDHDDDDCDDDDDDDDDDEDDDDDDDSHHSKHDD